MQHYLRQMDSGTRGHAPSEGEHQMAFQHWVAYIRGGCSRHPSDITPMEHLRCPLLWCRETFDNLASMLQHVSECPWLSNSWYWCPYCCRPESFMTYQEPYAGTLQHSIQRKDSKLKRAVTFFKHLGLKSCSRHKSGRSTSGHETETFDTWLAKRQRLEMEDTSYATRSELPDSNSDSHAHHCYCGEEAKNVYEMDGSDTYTSQDLEVPPRYTQDASTTLQELDAEPPFFGIHSIGATTDPTNFSTGMEFQCTAGRYNVEPWEEMLVSPASTTGLPFSHKSTEPITSPYADIGSVSPVEPNTLSLPDIVDHHRRHLAVALPHSTSPLLSRHDGNLCDAENMSTHSQVEELREIVRVLNEIWLLKCESLPGLAQHASAMSPRVLLDKGVQTLQQIFQGVLPGTFDAVFGLAHVACAAAYIMHGDDSSHCWNPLFHHMLKLQQLIANENDAQWFVQLVNLLWSPCRSSVKRSCGSHFLDEPSGTLVPSRRHVFGLEELLFDGTVGTHASQCTRDLVTLTTLRSLKDGVVLQECSRFLDGIEYAGILERSAKYPTHLPWYAQNHVTYVEEMSKTIIHPLQQCDGIEALHDAIHYTAKELGHGSLRSIREVEVSLMSNGKSSCLSPQIYKKYLNTVASLCDHAMQAAGPHWRDRYHATDIDVVLASVVEMDNSQRLDHRVPHHQRSTTIDAIPDTKLICHDKNISTPSPWTTKNQPLNGSSPSTVTSPTLTPTTGSSPATQSSPKTSPASSFSASSPSSSSSADITRCPLCPALFTGSARDRGSNLRRHMRTTRDHGNEVGLLCTVRGCGAVLSRSDNLGKHVRTVHPGVRSEMLRRAGARKRRRGLGGDDE